MITDLKPYAVMKHSGVEWLGSFPEHWELRRTKRLLAERSEKGCPDESLLAATQTQGVVRKEQYENRTVLALKDLQLLKIVRVGDFVISLRSFQGGIEFAREQGIISPAYTILYPFERDHHAYLAKVFKSRPYIENLSLFVKGIRQGQNIDYEKLARSCLPLPPLSEQIAIVRFLDHADRHIRRYIHAKQKLITLLEEQKQAIIHQAVTGQIDVGTGLPYPTYKASGVERLGRVPEHWEVKRFKSLVKYIDQGVSPQAENYLADGTAWGVLKAGCVNRGVFRESEHKRLAFDYAFDPILAVAVGDVLVSRASGSPHLVGSVGRVSSLKYNLILSDKTFRPIFNQEIDPDFMVLAMNGRYYRDQVERAISGAEGLANNLPLSSLRAFVFVVPSSDEQHEIVGYLRRSINELSVAVAYAERETLLLREYRTRLIADVVTGKLDVREAAATLPEVDPLAADDDLDDTIDADNRPEFDHEEEVSELEY